MTKPKLDLFIGSGVLESEELALGIAERLIKDLKPFEDKITLTYKGSFDKANRTSINSYRGPGIDEGMAGAGRHRRSIGDRGAIDC